jgi:hypothetical protein
VIIHIYNPRYLRGKRQEDLEFKASLAQISKILSQKQKRKMGKGLWI